MRIVPAGFTVCVGVKGDGLVAEQQNQIAFKEIDLMLAAGKIGVQGPDGSFGAARQRQRFGSRCRSKAASHCMNIYIYVRTYASCQVGYTNSVTNQEQWRLLLLCRLRATNNQPERVGEAKARLYSDFDLQRLLPVPP